MHSLQANIVGSAMANANHLCIATVNPLGLHILDTDPQAAHDAGWCCTLTAARSTSLLCAMQPSMSNSTTCSPPRAATTGHDCSWQHCLNSLCTISTASLSRTKRWYVAICSFSRAQLLD